MPRGKLCSEKHLARGSLLHRALRPYTISCSSASAESTGTRYHLFVMMNSVYTELVTFISISSCLEETKLHWVPQLKSAKPSAFSNSLHHK